MTIQELEQLAAFWQQQARNDYSNAHDATAYAAGLPKEFWQAEQRLDHQRAWYFLQRALDWPHLDLSE